VIDSQVLGYHHPALLFIAVASGRPYTENFLSESGRFGRTRSLHGCARLPFSTTFHAGAQKVRSVAVSGRKILTKHKTSALGDSSRNCLFTSTGRDASTRPRRDPARVGGASRIRLVAAWETVRGILLPVPTPRSLKRWCAPAGFSDETGFPRLQRVFRPAKPISP